MKAVKASVFGFGLLISSFASANVIYEWQTLSTSSSIWSAAGRIEITDAAWQAGHGSYQVPPLVYDSSPACQGICINYADPASPIVSFFFTINQPDKFSPYGIDVNIHNGTGLLYPIENWLNADFSIAGEKMNLSLFVNTQESDMQLADNVVTRFGSDAPYFGYECFSFPGCSGAVGQWVQVPEPASGALLGIGLLGIAGLRSRRRPLK